MDKVENLWSLQDAKAKLSELVRTVESAGPQILTVNGRKKILLTAYDEAMDENLTGAELVNILENSPLRELRNDPFPRSPVFMKNRPIEF